MNSLSEEMVATRHAARVVSYRTYRKVSLVEERPNRAENRLEIDKGNRYALAFYNRSFSLCSCNESEKWFFVGKK